MTKYGNGQFEFISESDRGMMQDAHKAISECELWDWLATFEPDPSKGFMFLRNSPELERINEKIYASKSGSFHSGGSYSDTMRNMYFIAQHGYDAFRVLFE